MATKAFHEIMSTRFWDFYPESLQNYRKTLFDNIAAHRPFVKEEERSDRPFFLSAKSGFVEKLYVAQYQDINWNKLAPEDKVISVIDVQGPILRNGDLCSYGSIHHRDIIMRAADDDRVIGFIVNVDSPGGSSFAKYDYESAINYARSKGKPVIGHIDGMACSAGYALMALCDEIYYTNPHDVVGCIGTMCAMYTQKDGDVNTVTQERYVEIYADGSPYKNKEYRDAADGKYDAMKKELNKSCVDFQSMVKARRPNVTEEQLKGYTYEAGEVEGSLVDAQGSFDFCVSRIQELSGVSQSDTQGESSGNSDAGNSQSGNQGDKSESEAETGKTEEKQPETEETATVEVVPATDNKQTQTPKQTIMAKTYLNIQSAAGVNALVVDENGGFYVVEEMADAIEAFCADAKQSKTTLAAKLKEVSELNALIEKERKDHAEALANLQVQHDAAIKALKDSHEKEIQEKEDSLADAQKQIEAKEAEIKELAEATTQSPAPQDPPKDNELHGGQEDKGFKVESICKENMTWAEKAEAMKKREEELKKAGA
ncbi:S49 family peptidase [Bacteroides caecigallinarum]|uniref:S49 family peptidase n=1 Tax=Bacteroides caecigallinarum TaxID=1411144 RepID=UPI00195CC5D1|nr:S49 family peptidase [Bacteroides caecigallinarum]MBM6865724.1 S49 family peptidase [Bacteroides caecigallinarum]